MKLPHYEFIRYENWKEQFLKDYEKITLRELEDLIGKVFVPLLLHKRGVKSEAFKGLSKEEQERVVQEELEVVWENHLIRILQILSFSGYFKKKPSHRLPPRAHHS